ncbi:MAG: hypothetical protein M3033_01625 [Acidobacteriota bacterium]|nr:hypothetical protein [Acidobacteriota bacterium]
MKNKLTKLFIRVLRHYVALVLISALMLSALPVNIEAQLQQGDAGPAVRTENQGGLTTTTFDTLVGTVTVNLPDDLAAGDTISGTVIAEEKKQAIPRDQAKNEVPANQSASMDELSGYVVEVATQETPMKQQGGNLIDFCKDPAQKQDEHSVSVCKKWSIPEGVSKIPVVLKNREGKIVSRAEVPVAPKVNQISGLKFDTPDKGGTSVIQKVSPAKASDYLTPPVGQAGKPLSVTGPFDGDFANTAIKIGNQTAGFLASSPRKVIVRSPANVKGVAEMEVSYIGKIVAKCVYRSISVNLAADKLNLVKGEQTSLTVTLAGLIGLLSPVSIQLTNKSPGTVSMAGGETQTVNINPQEVNGDIFSVKRTLTGVQAGGFAINALVNPAKAIPSCDSPISGNIPVIPKPQPSPGEQTSTPDPLDSGGNPRTNNGPSRPVPSLRARYRVTLNGFTANHVTYRGLFQRPDAVTFYPDISIYDVSGRRRIILQGGATNTIGMFPENRVQGGTSSANGGLQNGDGFPTQSEPWRRTVPYSTGAPGTIPPTVYFENELVQNTNAAVIIPNIWSVVGHDGDNLRNTYLDDLFRSRAAVGAAVTGMLNHPPRMELGNYLRSGSSMGVANTLSLGYGYPQDRPIGMHPIGGNRFGFTPQVLVLTYDSADYMSRTSFGFGPGIVPVRYVDDQSLVGDYTLYFLVERMDTMPPCAESIVGSIFTGTAELRTTREEAPGPYNSDVNLTVDFTDCRNTIRITNFPPLISNSVTRLGPNTSTMTMTAGGAGRFTASNGRIEIPITLGVQNSLAIFGNSTLPLTLTGTVDPATGIATLRGTGTFSGGQLGTFQGTIVASGTFSTRP